MRANVFRHKGKFGLEEVALWPGGKERMRRLMEQVPARRIDFGDRREGVVKVAVRP